MNTTGTRPRKSLSLPVSVALARDRAGRSHRRFDLVRRGRARAARSRSPSTRRRHRRLRRRPRRPRRPPSRQEVQKPVPVRPTEMVAPTIMPENIPKPLAAPEPEGSVGSRAVVGGVEGGVPGGVLGGVAGGTGPGTGEGEPLRVGGDVKPPAGHFEAGTDLSRGRPQGAHGRGRDPGGHHHGATATWRT